MIWYLVFKSLKEPLSEKMYTRAKHISKFFSKFKENG